MAEATKGVTEDLVGSREAREILSASKGQFQTLLRKRVLTQRRLPGCRPRFVKSELERIAASAMLPAGAN